MRKRYPLLIISLVTVLLMSVLVGNALARRAINGTITIQALGGVKPGTAVVIAWDWGAWDWGADWDWGAKGPQVTITLWQDRKKVATLVESCRLNEGSNDGGITALTKGKGFKSINFPSSLGAGIYELRVSSIDNPDIIGKLLVKLVANSGK